MNDVTLDYGDPHDTETVVGRQDGTDRAEEEEMDAEMQDWANQYEGNAADFEEQKMRKMQEIREGTKFYPLPREAGISAGANRGVSSQGEMNDLDILGPEGE
jgi:hypothetical protein